MGLVGVSSRGLEVETWIWELSPWQRWWNTQMVWLHVCEAHEHIEHNMWALTLSGQEAQGIRKTNQVRKGVKKKWEDIWHHGDQTVGVWGTRMMVSPELWRNPGGKDWSVCGIDHKEVTGNFGLKSFWPLGKRLSMSACSTVGISEATPLEVLWGTFLDVLTR